MIQHQDQNLPLSEVELRQELERIQVENLAFVEAWGKQMPAVAGVPVCQALSYELVQILNQLALQEIEVVKVEESEALTNG